MTREAGLDMRNDLVMRKLAEVGLLRAHRRWRITRLRLRAQQRGWSTSGKNRRHAPSASLRRCCTPSAAPKEAAGSCSNAVRRRPVEPTLSVECGYRRSPLISIGSFHATDRVCDVVFAGERRGRLCSWRRRTPTTDPHIPDRPWLLVSRSRTIFRTAS